MKLNDPKLLRTDSYVDGKWIPAPDGKTFPIHNPATGELIAEVADHGVETVKMAIAAAEKAQKGWAKRTAKERAMIMND